MIARLQAHSARGSASPFCQGVCQGVPELPNLPMLPAFGNRRIRRDISWQHGWQTPWQNGLAALVGLGPPEPPWQTPWQNPLADPLAERKFWRRILKGFE